MSSGKTQTNGWWILFGILFGMFLLFLVLQSQKRTQNNELSQSVEYHGCLYGSEKRKDDIQHGNLNRTYDGVVDMQHVFFLGKLSLEGEQQRTLKETFRNSAVACYRDPDLKKVVL